jgi:hypothetical protein
LLDAGSEADCWVIALGTNDLYWVWNWGHYGPSPEATVENYLTMMLDEVRKAPNFEQAWWVNINDHGWPNTSVTFNTVLEQRAQREDDLATIDWYGLSEPHPEWFVDDRHLTLGGYRVRAELIAATL